MSPSHHPEEALLVDYAAGNLGQPVSDASSIEAVLDRLETVESSKPDAVAEDPVFPAALLARMPAGPSGLRWWPAMPGLRFARFRLAPSGAAVWLLRMKANASLPRHSHAGIEAICVLEGQFTDSTGEYRRGDFAVFGSDTEHRVTAGRKGCMCILGLDGPLVFTGPIGWIAKALTKADLL